MKIIPGWDGRYLITEEGKVYRADGRLILPRRHPQGYNTVSLSDGSGKRRLCFVHRLLAQTFIPNPAGLPVVNHINGATTDNRLENLEWVTQGDNIRKAMAEKGNWLAKAPKRKNPVRGVDPTTGETTDHESLSAAIQWVSDKQVANGGNPITYARGSGNLSRASRFGGIWYGYRWTRLPVEKVVRKKAKKRRWPKAHWYETSLSPLYYAKNLCEELIG